jgi:hypothetical protein
MTPVFPYITKLTYSVSLDVVRVVVAMSQLNVDPELVRRRGTHHVSLVSQSIDHSTCGLQPASMAVSELLLRNDNQKHQDDDQHHNDRQTPILPRLPRKPI